MSESKRITLVLLVLFTIKPAIDLTWNQAIFSLAGRPFSLLHITGVFVFLYFGKYLLSNLGIRAPCSGIYVTFVLINFVSISATYIFIEEVPLIRIIDFMLRVLDSYIIYNVAYLLAYKNPDNISASMVRSVSLGTFIAVFLNLIAIKAGYGTVRLASNLTERQHGLYHDPGTLSNIALYNIIFTSYMLHLIDNKNIAWYVYSALTILISLYLIYVGVSRSVIVLIVIYALIYLVIFRKGAGKLVPIMFVSAAVFLGSIAGLNYGIIEQRFGSEIAVLDTSKEIETRKDKDVDLGRFERLGSNRGQIIAYTLDDFLKSPLSQKLIGNFNITSSHSDYIDVLTRNGFIGIVVYLTLLFSIWKKTVMQVVTRAGREYWPMCVMSFTLITLYILYSIPFRPLGYTTMAWFMWSIIGYTFGKMEQLTSNSSRQDERAGETALRQRQSGRRILARKRTGG